MFRSILSDMKVLIAVLVLAVPGSESMRADEIYLSVGVSDLTITEGKLPHGDQVREEAFSTLPPRAWRMLPVLRSYAVLDGPGEIYLDRLDGQPNVVEPASSSTGLYRNDIVAICLPEARPEITGTLFVPKDDFQGMVRARFKLAAPAPRDDAKARFDRSKSRHYQQLLALNIPGAAWFRHQVIASGGHLEPDRNLAFVNRGTSLEQTYSLFSGGRALSENLQLDRPIQERAQPGQAAQPPVKLDTLKGITVAEVDWKARIEGKNPALDPLASNIPSDQHALFVPNLKAMGDLLTLYSRQGMLPVLQLAASPRAEDDRTQSFYERQLGLAFADLTRLADLSTIQSLAATGSDPYLPSGTDLAMLFETTTPEVLTTFLGMRLTAARKADPTAEPVSGEVRGVSYRGAVSPDRRTSSYVATIGKVVVLTNSLVQLERIVAASKGEIENLVSLPEYRFFRDRYARGEDHESAFLVLSDATIRRWCGPRWRIGSSRRVRAAAYLSEMQAEHLRTLVEGKDRPQKLEAAKDAPDMGRLQWSRAGVASSIYGTLEFQTPIVEIPLEEVERSEADAYERWRDGYQSNWRGVFDPIALRISAGPKALVADVSVMPLIAASSYQPMIQVIGGSEIPEGAGDPHPEALLHAVMAVDIKASLMRQGADFVTNMTRVPRNVALSWLGPAVAAYLDDDPFWAEIPASGDPSGFLNDNWPRIPLGLHAEVTDAAKLALFLGGLRASIEQTSPDLLEWTTLKHNDRSYVRIAQRNNEGPVSRLTVYYATTPRSIVVSLNENVVKRFLDRQDQKKPAAAEPWLGKSLGLRMNRQGFQVLGRAEGDDYRNAVLVQCWSNLPVLNEWKRLFPDKDPVAVHEAVWGTRLVCPGGGSYVWNDAWQTMESTVYGHPGAPKPGPEFPEPLAGVESADFGITLKDQGLRGRVEVKLLPEP